MSTTEVGAAAPEFESASTAGGQQTLGDLRGSRLVLYFYPKDNTSGCTLEGQNFRDLHDEFSAADAVILGVSRESIRSHNTCLLYTSPSPRDRTRSRMPSSA